MEALSFLCLLVEKHPFENFSQHVSKLGQVRARSRPSRLCCRRRARGAAALRRPRPDGCGRLQSVLQNVSDSNYKISAVSLRVCARLTTSVLPDGARLLGSNETLVLAMYQATFGRLSSQDQDLEVKEAAISTMGEIIGALSDVIGSDSLAACLPVLLERLKNETTRITSLKALATIARSPLKIDVTPVCADAVTECAGFLRKNDRALKQAALTTLTALIASYAANIGPELQEGVIKELAGLISDTELHLTHLALDLCECMVQHAPQVSTALMHQHVLPRALVLLQSSLLQGAARESLKKLFATMVATGVPQCSFQALLDALLAVVSAGGGAAPLSRQALSSTAQCVSSLCGPVAATDRTATVERFIAELGAPATPEPVKLLLLHSLGEIGKSHDLSAFALEAVILGAFASGTEDTKAAASYALGSLAMGALPKYLPYMLQQVEQQVHPPLPRARPRPNTPAPPRGGKDPVTWLLGRAT